MTSTPYDPRSDSMHKSYDSRAYFRTRKIQAIERLLRFLYRRVAPDSRLVHRFRQWQINDLNEVLQGIFLQSREKNKSYRKDVLTLLSGKVKRDLTGAIRMWQLFVMEVRRERLTPEAARGAARMAKLAVGMAGRRWAEAEFPMFSNNSDRHTRLFALSHSFSLWKSRSIGFLLYDSRREMGAVRLGYSLYLRIKPLLLHSLSQLTCKRGWKLALQCLVPVLARVKDGRVTQAWEAIQRNEVPTGERSWESVYAGAVVAERVAVHITTRKTVFSLFKSYLKQSENGCRPALRSLLRNLKSNHLQLTINSFLRWKNSVFATSPVLQFDIDTEVIRNQMQIALLLEQQTFARKLHSAQCVKKIAMHKAFAVFRRGLRGVVTRWKLYRGSDRRDEDVLYEYVRFLEEQNGIERSRVPNRLR